MMNMPHCRFENTYKALQECQDVLDDFCFDDLKDLEDDANEYEKPYIRKLIAKCKLIGDEFSEVKDD